ncbi:MAG: transposase [Nitrospirae bacterium]|nr:transposase [Nitrospirota bacterium]
MKYNPEKHHRRSVRLREYEYSQAGAYFITICAKDRECLFGQIIAGKMILNEYGEIVQEYLDLIPGHFPGVELDIHIVMPNHIHGIIINNDCRGEVFSPGVLTPVESSPGVVKPQGGKTPPLQRKPTLGNIIAYFKYQTTVKINDIRDTFNPVWQRNYYERIIRNEHELFKFREYVQNNPLQWDLDKENPDNT